MWKELLRAWKSDSLLDRAWQESFEMLEIDQRMFLEAVRVLRDSDDDRLDQDIRKMDKQVNKYERDVRRKVMTHCTVSRPADLSSGMVLVSLVIDIERIGDYCKNIIDLAEAHPRRLVLPMFEPQLGQVESEVKQRFAQTIDILRHQDIEQARRLMVTFKAEVSRVCDEIVEQLVRGQADALPVTDAVAGALYARYLKRISAHLNNMVTSVVNPFDRIGFKEKKDKPAG